MKGGELLHQASFEGGRNSGLLELRAAPPCCRPSASRAELSTSSATALRTLHLEESRGVGGVPGGSSSPSGTRVRRHLPYLHETRVDLGPLPRRCIITVMHRKGVKEPCLTWVLLFLQLHETSVYFGGLYGWRGRRPMRMWGSALRAVLGQVSQRPR